MNTAPAIAAPPDVAELRRREGANVAAITAIDAKIDRLNLAKRMREAALRNIRCELARENGQAAPHDEPPN